ncbi:MAG: aminofutalosine synthase MqnE [Actinomycetota bacterium]|nr:aminofutalosine synthase MqnE [Actinomycetota bacterium]
MSEKSSSVYQERTVQNFLKDGNLSDIFEKILAGERLSREDGIRVYQSDDLLQIGYLADLVKQRKTGNYVYFINNRHINPSNICINRCKFCAFSRDKEDPDAYTMSLDEIMEAALESAPRGITELHIVGGLHPDLPFTFYLEMVKGLKEALPHVHIQAFTAVEIDYFSRISGLSTEGVLRQLKDVGLGSLPGGGAEIFSERARKKAWEKKISGSRWLEIMRTAHKLGIKSNATMLYGHIETIEERIDHLLSLRRLQDETRGFQAFIPLAFHPKNTELSRLSFTTGRDDLKTLAIARLMLDNFDHIKAFWIMIGIKLAQISLAFGVDDMDGTIVEEKITHAAGAETPEAISKSALIKSIKDAGRTPVERDTVYNVLKIYN